MKKYIVFDSTGHKVGIPFNSLKDAQAYKAIFGRYDWPIKLVQVKIERKSTAKQKAAVHFCEQWLHTVFEGNIEDFYEVSDFLSDYLDLAKEIAEDASASYWSMINGY